MLWRRWRRGRLRFAAERFDNGIIGRLRGELDTVVICAAITV